MSHSITAYTVHDEQIPGHVSLYRILPEVAVGEDGSSNVYSFDDLKIMLEQRGFAETVSVPNDPSFEHRMDRAIDYLCGQSKVGAWTGAKTNKEAMFFFEQPGDALAFTLKLRV